MRSLLTRWLALGSSLFTFSAALAGPPATAPLPADPHPLRFVPNRQQWEAPVLFAADIPAGRLFLEKNRLLVARYDTRVVEEQHHHRGAKGRIPAHAYAVNFVGANAKPAVRGEQPTGERMNYFLGNDRSRWAADVPAFTDVRYQQLYPGTDLRFYSRGPVMEYDFELAAGADARRIQLKYEGQQSLRVVDGALQIETSVGRVTEQKPFAYQLVNGRRVAVACQYVLKNNIVSFGLPKGYDHKLPLVIDPVLVYSTYSGATANLNWGYTACPDTAGNLYVGSANFSAGYPTTPGAYDASYNGGNTDIVISKYNPKATTGSSLVYATFIGGGGNANTANEYPHSLVTNDAGELFILGSSDATNYPTTQGAFRTATGGSTDLVVTRLAVNGNQLVASTYIGGSGVDGRMDDGIALYKNFGDDLRGDIVLDAQNNVYFTSVSRSTNYPSTGGFQTTRAGASDAVVTKLNPSLSAVLWSSYLGGTGNESGYSLQLSAQGDVYVAGGTTSNNFPRTAGGLLTAAPGGGADGFVARIGATGNQLLQSTYLGTASYDQAYFLQLGPQPQGNVYVLGQTLGAYPTTAGVYANAGSRQFIHQLSPTLNATIFSTVIGNGSGGVSGVPNISPTAFLVDNCGQLLLSGWGAANVAGLPTTPDALQPQAPNSTTSSNNNVGNTYGYLYLMQLAPGAQRLVYGSYFGTGTTHVDGGTSRFDKKGIIYQAICVRQTQNGQRAPAITTTPNAFARTQQGSNQTSSAGLKMDIARLNADFIPAANGVPNVRTGCAPLTVNFSRATPSATTTTTWNFGNGSTSTQPNNVSTTYNTPGTYTVTLTVADPNSCIPPVSTTTTIIVRGLAKISAGPDRTICPSSSATLTVTNTPITANYAVNWTPATGLNTTTGLSVTATPSVTTTYIVTLTELGTGGCESKDTVTVNVSSQLNVSVPAPAPLCAGSSTTLEVPDAGPGATYAWSPANGLSATNTRTVTATPAATTTYTVTVTTPGGCTGTATSTVTVQQPLALVATATPANVTLGEPVAFTGGAVVNPVVSYTWDFGDGQTSSLDNPTHTYAAPGTYTVTLRGTVAPGCESTATTTVTVLAPVPLVIPNIITPNHDGANDTFLPQQALSSMSVTLEVYNRWGRKVFEQVNYGGDWGSDDSIAPGVYYYRLVSANGKTWNGWLEVVK